MKSRINKMRVTHGELRDIIKSFQRVREKIEASYQGILQSLEEMKDKYLAKLQEAADAYECIMEQVIKESHENAWRGPEYTHPEPFVNLILKHELGENSDFGLCYQVQAAKEHLNDMLTVKWALPFSDFASYPEDALPVKVATDEGTTFLFIMLPNQTLADLRTMLESKNCQVSSKMHFCNETGDLIHGRRLDQCNLNANTRLFFTIKAVLNVTNSDNKEYCLLVDLHCKISEFMASLPPDSQPLPVKKYLIYEDQWLDDRLTFGQTWS